MSLTWGALSDVTQQLMRFGLPHFVMSLLRLDALTHLVTALLSTNTKAQVVWSLLMYLVSQLIKRASVINLSLGEIHSWCMP